MKNATWSPTHSSFHSYQESICLGDKTLVVQKEEVTDQEYIALLYIDDEEVADFNFSGANPNALKVTALTAAQSF